MGTSYTVRAIAPPGETIDKATVEALIRSRLAEVDGLMSTYDSTSELSRFNRHVSTQPFPLSPLTLEVLTIALDVSGKSGGAFDATVAPLVNAWGFGPTPGSRRVPLSDEIARLRERVGFRHVLIDSERGMAAKTRPDVVLDLSAIAKGYAVDRVADALEEAGYAAYLVEVGGEVRGGAEKPTGDPWRVAVEAPRPGERRVQGVIELRGLGIATSGDYRNARVLDGERFAHIVDPRTGNALRQRGFSVSVVHPRTLVADAWATALMVLGPDVGYELASEQGIAALFLTLTGDGVGARATLGFPALLPRAEE